jgi:hypothetical protein
MPASSAIFRAVVLLISAEGSAVVNHRSGQTIAVNRNTLILGRQVYQLRNLVRIQEAGWRPESPYGSAWSIAARLLAVLVLTAVVGSFPGEQRSLVLLVGVLLLALYAYRLFRTLSDAGSRHFAVIIETNGSATAVLTSRVPDDVHRLFTLLAEALENPPDRRVEWNFQSIEISDDQINRHNLGSGPQLGKQVGRIISNG